MRTSDHTTALHSGPFATITPTRHEDGSVTLEWVGDPSWPVKLSLAFIEATGAFIEPPRVLEHAPAVGRLPWSLILAGVDLECGVAIYQRAKVSVWTNPEDIPASNNSRAIMVGGNGYDRFAAHIFNPDANPVVMEPAPGARIVS